VVDEFQKFVTSDFADALERMRGYGISFILAHQHRDQFMKEAPEVLRSIDSCCLNKVIFTVARKDAEDLAVDIYSGKIHEGAEEVKDEVWHKGFRPVKKYEKIVGYSESGSSSHTTSASQGWSHGRTTGRTTGTSRSSGSVSSFATVAGMGRSYAPDSSYNPTFTTTQSYSDGWGLVENVSESVTESESETFTHSESEGEADSKGQAKGWSVSSVPIHEYEEYQERGGRTFRGLEEVKERYIAQVKNQPARHAHWKFKANDPVRLVTPTVEPVYVTKTAKGRFTEAVYVQSARPTAEVIREIEGRVDRFLKLAEASRSSSMTDGETGRAAKNRRKEIKVPKKKV
jgi:hypothetical protein